MERIRDTIKLDSSLPWTETLTVTYPETIEVDHEDDLERELALCVALSSPFFFKPKRYLRYKQALHGAEAARNLATQHSLPWTRPSDYFAEMVKNDAHMERIRQRLLDEKADMKRSEQKKKEREGKKYGKQIQIEKIKEREKSKKEVEERLKALKRSTLPDFFSFHHQPLIANRFQNVKTVWAMKMVTHSTSRSKMPLQIDQTKSPGTGQVLQNQVLKCLETDGTASSALEEKESDQNKIHEKVQRISILGANVLEAREDPLVRVKRLQSHKDQERADGKRLADDHSAHIPTRLCLSCAIFYINIILHLSIEKELTLYENN